MAGFSTQNNEHLIRGEIWDAQLKKVFDDERMGTKYVRMLDFPDGDQLTIPSIGHAEVLDYVEGNPIQYTAFDTGEFNFTINKYKSSATWVTDKMKQDSFYMSQLQAAFVPEQARALACALENDVMAVGPDNQTPSNSNAINGYSHRWVGSGVNETIDVVDFANARIALQEANVPMTNLIAIVDPTVEYAISTQSNIVNLLSPVPTWSRIVNEGSLSGMQFKYSIFGFDVYVSHYLKGSIAETVNGKSVTTGKANLFFSAAGGDSLPFVGAIRQAPRVETERNKDFQRDEYVTTARWGFDLYRPENLCVVLTDTDQVSF